MDSLPLGTLQASGSQSRKFAGLPKVQKRRDNMQDGLEEGIVWLNGKKFRVTPDCPWHPEGGYAELEEMED